MPDFRRNIGVAGEERAAQFLSENGYDIIARNWRTKSGEIDIIAYKDPVLVFVEVKTLPRGDTRMLEQVLGTVKQKRIIETAKYFLLEYRQYSNSCIRFDAVVIDMPGYDSLYHIENAFSE